VFSHHIFRLHGGVFQLLDVTKRTGLRLSQSVRLHGAPPLGGGGELMPSRSPDYTREYLHAAQDVKNEVSDKIA
jgi:hypothetical protein